MNIETIINTLKQEFEVITKQQEELDIAIHAVVNVIPELTLQNYNDAMQKHPAICELVKLEDKYMLQLRKLTNAIKELEEMRDFKGY